MHSSSHTSVAVAVSNEPRKSYSKPTLVEYGTIVELTKTEPGLTNEMPGSFAA